jgi:hypothetical protein
MPCHPRNALPVRDVRQLKGEATTASWARARRARASRAGRSELHGSRPLRPKLGGYRPAGLRFH